MGIGGWVGVGLLEERGRRAERQNSKDFISVGIETSRDGDRYRLERWTVCHEPEVSLQGTSGCTWDLVGDYEEGGVRL